MISIYILYNVTCRKYSIAIYNYNIKRKKNSSIHSIISYAETASSIYFLGPAPDVINLLVIEKQLSLDIVEQILQ